MVGIDGVKLVYRPHIISWIDGKEQSAPNFRDIYSRYK